MKINGLEMKSSKIWTLLNKTGGLFGQKSLWAQPGLAQNETSKALKAWSTVDLVRRLWTLRSGDLI